MAKKKKREKGSMQANRLNSRNPLLLPAVHMQPHWRLEYGKEYSTGRNSIGNAQIQLLLVILGTTTAS